MACVLLCEMRDLDPNYTVADAAAAIAMNKDIKEDVLKTMQNMEDSGRRYILWEQDLGQGALFVLGNGLHESL